MAAPLPQNFHAMCNQLLTEADQFAVQNVESGRGGPFSARFAIIDPLNGECAWKGDMQANAVLATGLGSAHAEDQAMQPHYLENLVSALTDWKSSHPGRKPLVVFISSGQSCQACYAKEEIIARWLIDQKLIEAKDFVVYYGAPFEDTAKIADFNDLPYVADMVRSVQEPNARVSMVRHKTLSIAQLPPQIRARFLKTRKQTAIIARGNRILSVARDARRRNDPVSTAEVVAIRKACAQQKHDKVPEPWSLGDKNHLHPAKRKKVKLYTTTRDLGPLMRGEAQWASVNEIITVNARQKRGKSWVTLESKGKSNQQLLCGLAEGYNHKDTVIRTFVDPQYANLAQRAWKARLEEWGSRILYNGMGADQMLTRYAGRMQRRFIGAHPA